MGWISTSSGAPGGQGGEGRAASGGVGWVPLVWIKGGFKSGDKGAFGVRDSSWGSGSNPEVGA